MRKAPLVLSAALIAPLSWAGDVQVRSNAGRVDVVATNAALQDVLARLAQQTGMKVVYDGAPPRTLVTVSLPQRTPAEAVLSLFDGLGINYAMALDRSGTKVDTLIVTSATPGPARAVATPPPAAVPGADRRPPIRPQPAPDAERADERDDEPQADEQTRPQPIPTPPVPVIFQGPILGPGRPGSPFGGQIGPLTLPTPAPPAAAPPAPAPSPTPSPGPNG